MSSTNSGGPKKPDDLEEKKREIRRAARRERAIERLGKNNPACIRCGQNNPLCLELHHVAGRAYSDDTIILCRNCHRELSGDQKDHPDKITEIPSTNEVIAHWLLGLADLFELLVRKCREFAGELFDRANDDEGNPPAVRA